MSRTAVVSLIVLVIFFTSASGWTAGRLICNRINEEYQCGSACQTTCENLNLPCLIVNVRCNDACYCKEGYARIGGDRGTCIPISKCPHERAQYISHDSDKN